MIHVDFDVVGVSKDFPSCAALRVWRNEKGERVFDVRRLVADSQELSTIRVAFSGIKASQCTNKVTWTGEDAQFIFDNL